jgi:hypothetical protein
MVFDIRQLDSLEYDEAEEQIDEYLDGVMEEYIQSPEGEEYFQDREEGGSWIATFIEMGFRYEEFKLSKMSKADVQLLMETILPRKLTLLEPTEADDAIPELVSFWKFLDRTYQLRNAKSIIQYLQKLGDRFPQLMNDPNTGGFLKGLLLQAHQQGFDISSQEGLKAFQEKHNAEQQALREREQAEQRKKMEQKNKKSENVPKTMQAKYDEIIALTDKFAQKHLNEEYAEMSRLMTAALCRKRPSPLERGKANTWACGIIHAVGTVNFLFDRSQTPYISAGDLAKAFGIGQSTSQGKSKEIRDALKINILDPKWTLPSRLADNPRAWLIEFNGLIVDARSMSRDFQEEAYNRGLIPYLPD